MNNESEESVLIPLGAILTIFSLVSLAFFSGDSPGLSLIALLSVGGVSAGIGLVMAGSKL